LFSSGWHNRKKSSEGNMILRQATDKHIGFTKTQNFSRIGIGILMACIALLAWASPAQAQLTSASVNGTVRDASGAALPGATVVLRSPATNTARTSTSNQTGGYTFIDVDPGVYTIDVSMAGFETVHQNAVPLAVNQTASFDFRMAVGEVTQPSLKPRSPISGRSSRPRP
jgi:hypothetical protein